MNTTAAPQTVLYIKNMVCDRCRMAVEQILRRNDLAFDHIELGKVYLHETPTARPAAGPPPPPPGGGGGGL